MEINNNNLSLDDKINNLVLFLNKNRITSEFKDIVEPTHISLNNEYITPGSFKISNIDEFKKLYIDVISDKQYKTIKPLSLLEVPYKEKNYFERFKFDFDFKIKDTHYNEIKKSLKCDRLYNNEVVNKIILLISRIIYNITKNENYKITDGTTFENLTKEYSFVIFEKKEIRYNNETKEYKDGFHIIIDNLYISYNNRVEIFNIIKSELSNSDIFFYLPEEYLDIDKIFDDVIYKNWLLYGSSKQDENQFYKATRDIVIEYSNENNDVIISYDKPTNNIKKTDLFNIYSLFSNHLYYYKIDIEELNIDTNKKTVLVYDNDNTTVSVMSKLKKHLTDDKIDYDERIEIFGKYKINILYYPNNIETEYNNYKFGNIIKDKFTENLIKPIEKNITVNDIVKNEDEYRDDECFIIEDNETTDNILDNDKFDYILSLLPDEYYSQCYTEWIKLVSFCKINKLDINIVDKHSKRGSNYNKVNNFKNYRSNKGYDGYKNNTGWLYNRLKEWNNEAFENIRKNRKEKLRLRYLPYKILSIIENEPDLINYIINDPQKPYIKYSNNYIFCFNDTNCIWEIVDKNNIIFIIQDIINKYKKMYIDMFRKKELDKCNDEKEIKELEKIFKSNCKKFDATIKTKNISSFIDRFLNHPNIFDDNFYNLINKSKYDFPIKNNKVINLLTKKIRQRTKEDYFSFYSDVEYISNEMKNKYNNKTIKIEDNYISPSELFNKFIDNFTLSDNDTKLYLQKILGYYISGETNANIFYVFCGAGANGKSTIFNLLYTLLNRTNKDNNVISLGEDVLIQGKNGNRATQIKDLQNARIGICQETPTGAKLNINLIKQITGGDKIAIEEKFAINMTKLSITTKLIISTNNKPEFDGESHANIRRFRYFNCDCRFVSRETSNKNERKGIDNIEELLKNNCMDLFFSWIVEGSYNYFSSDDKKLEYNIPEKIKQVQNEYINLMASVKSFVDNKIIKSDNVKDYIKRSEIYKIYEVYCNDELGISPLKKKDFFEKINNFLGEPSKSNGDMIFKSYKLNIQIINNNNDLDD